MINTLINNVQNGSFLWKDFFSFIISAMPGIIACYAVYAGSKNTSKSINANSHQYEKENFFKLSSDLISGIDNVAVTIGDLTEKNYYQKLIATLMEHELYDEEDTLHLSFRTKSDCEENLNANELVITRLEKERSAYIKTIKTNLNYLEFLVGEGKIATIRVEVERYVDYIGSFTFEEMSHDIEIANQSQPAVSLTRAQVFELFESKFKHYTESNKKECEKSLTNIFRLLHKLRNDYFYH